jgi:hypothetical protein
MTNDMKYPELGIVDLTELHSFHVGWGCNDYCIETEFLSVHAKTGGLLIHSRSGGHKYDR